MTLSVCVCVCICICISICVCIMCMYIYIYLSVHAHTIHFTVGSIYLAEIAGKCDNEVNHYQLNLKESASARRLTRLPSNPKNGVKFRHACYLHSCIVDL